MIKGIGTMAITQDERKLKQTMERYKPIVTETVWTIWKLRNRKIFEGTPTNFENTMKTWKKGIEKKDTDRTHRDKANAI